MRYIIHYDVAALVIFAVTIYLFQKKQNLPTLQNKFFMVLLGVCTAATALDLLTALSDEYHQYFPTSFLWVLNIIYFIVLNTATVIYYLYSLALTEKLNNKYKFKKNTYYYTTFLPYIVSLVLILSSPITNWIFYFTEDNVYTRNFGILYLTIASGFYVALSVIMVIHYALKDNKFLIKTHIFYGLFCLVAVILQIAIEGLLIQCFAFAISILILYNNVQRPEYYLDSNTKAYNQAALSILLKKSKYTLVEHSMLAIILDELKFFENNLGFNYTNTLLAEISAFLQTVSKDAFCFYLNQGRFLLFLTDTNKNALNEAIDKITHRFHQTWGQQNIILSKKICIIHYPTDADNAETVVDLMDSIKSDTNITNTHEIIFAENLEVNSQKRRIFLEHTIKEALYHNKLDVHYQPIYSIADKKIIGAEALIRMYDENEQSISPEEFIPIAEKSGAILRLGEYVMESVCRMVSEIDYKYLGIKKLDINLSVIQCMQDNLAEKISSILQIYQVPRDIINFEITETAAAHSQEILQKNIKQIADLGFEISMDDYGSGYSNMNYLLNLPFKMIKIDKYIIWEAFNNRKASVALAATIKIIKAMNMTVLAEGVETEEQAAWLTVLGCDYLQGFFFSKPVKKDQFLHLLIQSNREANYHSDYEDLEDIAELEAVED